MNNAKKVRELARKHQGTMTDAQYLQLVYALEEMDQWKDEQLDSAIDKSLQRNGDFLKQGKITQYGYDIAFCTIQNIREYLKQ